MKINELMTRDVRSCSPQDTLNDAAHVMWSNDCGCVPVTDDDGHVVGMLTDRDVCMAAYTRGVPLAQMNVAEAMSTTVHSVAPDDELARAEEVMARHQVRRLPVIGDNRRLVGLVSFNDLARQAAEEVDRRKPALPARDLSLALGKICKPRICRVAEHEPAVTAARGRKQLVVAS